LQSALQKAKLKAGNRKWQNVYHALKSVRSDKHISGLANQLDNIRKQVDTAILISICQSPQQLPTQSTHQTSTNSSDVWPGKDTKRRHAELLSSIHSNNWRPSLQHDANAFSKYMDSFATEELKLRFHKSILSRLYFRNLPDRNDRIADAYSKTFEWLFQDRIQRSHQQTWASFIEWLQADDESIYWATGKPGSGKSTLMKFLYHHRRLPVLLKKWAKQNPLARAGFYFWNSGTAMQMSRLGLLQSLLYGCFVRNNDLMLSAMPERWEDFLSFGGGQEPFDEQELQTIFDRVIADDSRRFFFIIDGLDEFDGQPKEIIGFIVRAARPNVKLCIASRPWLPFEDAFKQRPNLLLERLTREDIFTYTSEHLEANEHYKRLQKYEPTAAAIIVPQVVQKACGVFLWVYLVVDSLLEGLSNADQVSNLQARLDGLPSDLEALFNTFLGRLQPEYFREACGYFRLMNAHSARHPMPLEDYGRIDDVPTLLEFYFADDADTKSSLLATCKPLEHDDACNKAEKIRRRLVARCKGMLEVATAHLDEYGSPLRHTDEGHTITYDDNISYLHRTARDYVEAGEYWEVVLQST
ncbi:hypothetical protein GQ44DRAFT_590443, partial [Phaeosphaeriaceae sp. PMI808]